MRTYAHMKPMNRGKEGFVCSDIISYEEFHRPILPFVTILAGSPGGYPRRNEEVPTFLDQTVDTCHSQPIGSVRTVRSGSFRSELPSHVLIGEQVSIREKSPDEIADADITTSWKKKMQTCHVKFACAFHSTDRRS